MKITEVIAEATPVIDRILRGKEPLMRWGRNRRVDSSDEVRETMQFLATAGQVSTGNRGTRSYYVAYEVGYKGRFSGKTGSYVSNVPPIDTVDGIANIIEILEKEHVHEHPGRVLAWVDVIILFVLELKDTTNAPWKETR